MPQVESYVQNGVNFISVAGDIEMFDITEFKKTLYGLLRSPNYAIVELDLGRVNYIDSSGLAALVGFAKTVRREGRKFRLLRMRAQVADLVHLAGLDTFFREE